MNDSVQLELELNQNGVAQALANIQKSLDGLVKGADQASASMGKVGTSASSALDQTSSAADKTTHATAGVTREFIVLGREIATGNFARLPGSMLVLANRTGILSSLFSGLGAAGIATAGVLGVLAAAGVAVGAVFAQTAAQEHAFNNAMIETSNYAGLTQQSFKSMQATVAASSGSWSHAKDAIQALAASGRFTTDQMKQLGPVVVAQAQITGKSIDEIVKQFEGLADSPKKFTDEVNKTMHIFTGAQQQQIDSLIKEGKEQQAVNVAIQGYSNWLEKNSAEIENNKGWVDKLTDSFGRMWHAFSGAVDKKSLSPQDQLNDLDKKIQQAQKGAGTSSYDEFGVNNQQMDDSKQKIADYVAQKKAILKQMAEDDKKSTQDSLDAWKNQNSQQALQYRQSLNLLTKYQEDEELAKNKAMFAQGRGQDLQGFSQAEEEKAAAAIRDKYIDKDAAADAERKARQSFQDRLADLEENMKEYENGVKVGNAKVKAALDEGNITQEEADKQLYDIQIGALNKRKEILAQEMALSQQEVSRTGGKDGTSDLRKEAEETKQIYSEIEVADAQYEAEQAKHAQEARRHQQEIANVVDEMDVTIQKQITSSQKAQDAQLNKIGLSTREAALQDSLNAITAQYTDLINKEAEALKKLGATDQQILDAKQKLLAAEADAVAKEKVYSQQRIDADNNWLAVAQKNLKDYSDSALSAGAAAKAMTDALTKGIEDTLYNAMVNGKLSMQTLEQSIVQSIDRIVAKALTANIDQLLFGGMAGGSGGGAGLIGMLGSLFGGARAQGGPVQPGQIYSVNENTPNSEYFVPTTPGMIIPAGGIQASQGNSTHVTIHAVDAPSFRQLLSRDPRFITELVNNTAQQYGM